MKMKSGIPRLLSILTFATTLCFASGAHAQRADAESQAAAHHERGISLFQSGQYQAAIAEFESAESIAHSRANLRNIARCHQELGSYGLALGFVDRYLAEPYLTDDDRARAIALRQELLSQQNGAAPSSGLIGPWVLLGSGLAILLTGAVLDIVAYVQVGTDHNDADPFESQRQYEDWYESAWNLAVAGDVLVGVGAAATVAGLVWLLVARRRSSSARADVPLFSLAASRDGLALSAGISF